MFDYYMCLYVMFTANLICAPFIIRSAKIKMIEVMNNAVNSSYSQISINILKIVVVQEYLLIVAVILFGILIIYVKIESYDKKAKALYFIAKVVSNILNYVNDVVLVF